MNKVYYSVEEFQKDCSTLAYDILSFDFKFEDIYPIKRGGIIVALEINKHLKLPIIDNPNQISKTTLVVDDIVDSGNTRLKFSECYFVCLHTKNVALPTYYVHKAEKDSWIDYWWEKNECSIEESIIRIFQLIGEDPNRIGIIDTPKRIAKMYKEMFRGYNEEEKPKITVFPNGVDGINFDEMIIDSGYFFSHCEHHMVPFFGEYHFAYVPNKLILGASKISRIVDFHAARLQVAERLGQMIINDLYEATNPTGMILSMKARHLCKEMRGVKKWNSPFETIHTKGIFKTNQGGCKDEFLSRIR